MALRAGYIGIKKTMLGVINSLSDAKIIKSVTGGLKLTSAGALSVNYGKGLKVEGGKLIGTGGAFEAIQTGEITLPATASTLTDSIELDFIPDIITVDAPLTDKASNCYYSKLVSPGISFWYIPDETKQELNNTTPNMPHAAGLHIAEVYENTFKMKTGNGSNTIGRTVTYTAYKLNKEV